MSSACERRVAPPVYRSHFPASSWIPNFRCLTLLKWVKVYSKRPTDDANILAKASVVTLGKLMCSARV